MKIELAIAMEKHGGVRCCGIGERVIRTKVNSVGRIPGRLSPPLDYTRFVGARNRSSDRCRVKGRKEEVEEEAAEKKRKKKGDGREEGGDGDGGRLLEGRERRGGVRLGIRRVAMEMKRAPARIWYASTP